MQERQLGGSGKIEVIEEEEEEDEIVKELEELLKKLEMIAIMRAPKQILSQRAFGELQYKKIDFWKQ